MKTKHILELISFAIFLMFVYAAGSKLIDYKLFVFQMNMQPFDDKYTNILAFGLPILEFIIAALLIFKRTLLTGLWLSLILMIFFTGYIVLIELNYYGTVPCSCGGIISKLSWSQHLIFNLFFVLISIIGIVIYKRNKNYQVTFQRSIKFV